MHLPLLMAAAEQGGRFSDEAVVGLVALFVTTCMTLIGGVIYAAMAIASMKSNIGAMKETSEKTAEALWRHVNQLDQELAEIRELVARVDERTGTGGGRASWHEDQTQAPRRKPRAGGGEGRT